MPKYRSLSALQADLRAGAVTLPAVVDYYLAQIRAQAALNAYVEIYETEVQRQAQALQVRFQDDPASVGRLFGMVLSIKDVICHAGHGVTAGSRILEGFESLYSATAVERLLAEDALIIGRVNCDEFAMGSTNETSVYGPVRNAADPGKVPGGSSGGSAVAVQADTCLASLGSDTGGSVRQPAAFCGLVGLKPTYGRVSRYGLLAYGSSFDQIGVLAHSVEDAALLLEVMAGPDEYDPTAAPQAVPPYPTLLEAPQNSRIAYIRPAVEHPRLDPEIRRAAFDLIEALRADGHTVEPVAFDLLEYIIPAYYVLTTAEASSNLSRYDGIRYGYRSREAHDLLETYRKSRTEGFGREVKRRIMLGTFVLSAGYYDAYYGRAQRVRRLIQEQTLAIFQDYDFLLSPVAPTTAWDLGESLDDPVAMYLADIFTVQANMAGIPAVALPAAAHSNGLPIGLQLMANRFEEASLLAFAKHVHERYDAAF